MNIINKLNQLYTNHRNEVDQWFINKIDQRIPLFYYSVDIRYSGQKLAPVDTNIYPAGFNNISPFFFTEATKLCQDYFNKYFPQAKTIAILGENHTRNKYYLENLSNLAKIIQNTGLNVICGNTNNEQLDFLELNLYLQTLNQDGENLFDQEGRKIDLIVLNSDLTNGIPEMLQNISTPIIPQIDFGWFNRRKSNHFCSYQTLAKDFAERFDLDSSYFTTAFASCGMVNFRTKEGLECVASKAKILLEEIAINYKEHSIAQTPYLFIKANKGTYGMGVMAVQSADEILNINKNDRHSMSVVKGGTPNTDVIIQEGISTIDQHHSHTAEAMVYGIAAQPLELLYRVHSKKDNQTNLNSTGMYFINSTSNNDILYNDAKYNACALIARLSATACLFEI